MNIAYLRKQAGMSQKEFADYLGIPVGTIQEWEQGRRTPAPYITELIGIRMVCKIHSISVNELKAIYDEINPDIMAWDDLNWVIDTIQSDLEHDYLVESKARNGRDVLCYCDENHTAAIYRDTRKPLTEEEIENQLY